MKKQTILFVCTGNTCRSPLSQFYASSISNRFIFDSAGINVTENTISENSGKILQKNGINYTSFKPKQLNDILIKSSKLVITMTKEQAILLAKKYTFASQKIFSLGDISEEKSDIDDPYEKNIEEYEKTYNKIKKQINLLLQKV